MLKGLYDTDCATWSPQGKLFQVQYAMEAVKQGSICLGLRSKDFVVLGSLKKLPSQLAGYQQKLFKVDDQIGMAMSGLTADARVLCKFMRNQCIDHRYKFGTHHPLNRLVLKIAEKSQHKTQNYFKRPYGVGLLIAGYDKDGPHLFQTCPSGNYYQYYANAIGARSQSARTYLETHLQRLAICQLQSLILHALAAITKSASEQGEVNEKSVQIGIVGKGQPFRRLTQSELKQYLGKLSGFKPYAGMEAA